MGEVAVEEDEGEVHGEVSADAEQKAEDTMR